MRAAGLVIALSLLATGAQAQGANPGLIRLHDQLKLDPGQETAWNSYAAAVTPGAEAQARRSAVSDMLPKLPTPRRIALIQAAMAQDAADFQAQGKAIVAFYTQLTPSQQQVFDAATAPPADGSSQPSR